jgi:signal transduction histidine kinase
MRAFAIEVLEPAGIDMQFDIRPDLLNIHLNMQQRKNVYLIFKEAINNILKYAACTQVSIRMERLGTKRWMMEIVDNGIGFEKASANSNEISLSGNGIRNMQKRAEEVNGSFDLQSSPGHGVKVSVTFIL